MTVENPLLNGFMQLHNLFHLIINEPTYFQSNNPTCIDSVLTSRKAMFKTPKTFESGLS